MTLFLVVSEIRGGVFKVYAKKEKGQQQKLRQPDYERTSGSLIMARHHAVTVSSNNYHIDPRSS